MKIRKSSPQKLAYMKRYSEENRERERKRTKDWWAVPENRKRAIAQQCEYAKEHREVNNAAQARYRKRHRERLREENRLKAIRLRKEGKPQKRHNERYLNDPLYNIRVKIRSRIGMAFWKAKKGTRRHDTIIKLLGCSYAEFKQHIESKFTEGMTWAKVIDGLIHIDHKTPISSYDLTDSLQQKAAFHFTNTQPMWAEENLSKGNKIIEFKAA